MKHVKAILFDNGDTLARPASGNWFVPTQYAEMVAQELGGWQSPTLRQAFQKAYNYLGANHRLDTEAEEYEQFLTFYRMLLTDAGYPNITKELIAALAQYMVYNDAKFTFFDDTLSEIPRLAEHFKLGIISDTWPSLDRVFRQQNLRQYFTTFVMSSSIGVFKPHPRMYTTALEELQLPPEQTVFVDDSVENLEGAAKLSMHAVLIDRYSKHENGAAFPKITNLLELRTLVEMDTPDM